MRIVSLLTTLLLSAGLAHAGPLDASRVPADAPWLVHIDVHGLRESTIGQFILENADELHLDLGDLEDIEAEIGLNPREDIFSATIIGFGSNDDVTIVLETTDAIDEVIATIKGEDAYSTFKFHGHTLHRWDDGGSTLAFIGKPDEHGHRLVVLGEHQGHIDAILKVIDGTSRSLQDVVDDGHGSSTSILLPGRGSLLYACAHTMPWIDDSDDKPASMIARKSERVVVDISESDGVATLHASVSAKSDDEAKNIGDVIRGVVAMGRLLADFEPDLAECADLLNSITVKIDGRTISVHIKGLSGELVRHVHALAEAMD